MSRKLIDMYKEKIKLHICNILGLLIMPIIAIVLIITIPVLILMVHINCTKENKNAR